MNDVENNYLCASRETYFYSAGGGTTDLEYLFILALGEKALDQIL